MLNRAKLLVMVLGSLIALVGVTSAGAADWGRDCDRRIAHEQHELNRAMRHGNYSHQAEYERRELDRLYAECRYRDRSR